MNKWYGATVIECGREANNRQTVILAELVRKFKAAEASANTEEIARFREANCSCWYTTGDCRDPKRQAK
jgi:hypothetical protein